MSVVERTGRPDHGVKGNGAAIEIGSNAGVLNVRKAAGWTSHDVVEKLRGVFRGPKVGHGGTLDPAATGVLPILIGRATRIAEYLVEWDKEYDAVLRLGAVTDTQDATGAVLATHSTAGVTPDRIDAAVAQFRGRVSQVPPMYSAVKVNGAPLYKAARAGRTIERESRDVTVYRIDVLGVAGDEVSLRVQCSKGTYIRTLCADIGRVLGVGGYLQSLDRRRVGPLTVDRALTVEEVEEAYALGRLSMHLLSLDQALAHFPVVSVEESVAGRVRHGVPIPIEAVQSSLDRAWSVGRPIRVRDPAGRLVALGRMPHLGAEGDAAAQAISILKVLAEEPAGQAPGWSKRTTPP
jgi:tRNA pseudouridine55 synthase